MLFRWGTKALGFVDGVGWLIVGNRLVVAIMSVGLTSYLMVSASLFRIGLVGLILNQRSVILVLMCVELMLLAVNVQRMAFSVYLDDVMGQVFSLYVLTVAAAESAIGLAILVIYFRVRGTISMDSMNLMQG